MRFGSIPVGEAEGAIAAHTVRHAGGVVRKGTRLEAGHIAELLRGGVMVIVAARLDSDDVHEDAAAARIAARLAGPHVRREAAFTGRCNLFAEAAGLLRIDAGGINVINRIDAGLTVATLNDAVPVEAGRMVATVKIIPFALPAAAVAAAETLAAERPPIALAPWRPLRVGLAATMLPSLKASVLDKTRRVLEDRLRPAGATIAAEARVAHEAAPLAAALAGQRAAGAELLVVFGASAIADAADVIPEALRRAGGRVVHFGMPVDPGNLLLLGELGGVPVLGAPGCARSPAENGFDLVLNRLLAGIPVSGEDIAGMGVGGLMTEIGSRPQPRQPLAATPGPVAAVILAAGRSRRMGGPNKLLATFDGAPLVRRMAEAALASRARPAIVVTGHMGEAVAAALAGLPVRLVHNADHAEGLSTSLRTGIGAVPPEAAGALVMLADMPGVTAAVIDRLIDEFSPEEPCVVLPTVDGKRGNPVLWSRHFFGELAALSGDSGARHLIARHEAHVRRVEIGRAAGLDVDTPEALEAAGGRLPEREGGPAEA